MSLFWGLVVAGIGAYVMRASVIVLLWGVTVPSRVIRVRDHGGRGGMPALVVTTLTNSGGELEAGPIEFVTLAVMASVTLWRNNLLIGLCAGLIVFFTLNSVV